MSHIRSLDGLRGLAALLVLLHHSLLLVTPFSTAVTSPDGVEPWSVGWWTTQGPLLPFALGNEAVVVFFVLSGFVLARSVVRARRDPDGYDWVAYFPRRLARLWLPAIASIGLALLTIRLLPHHGPDPVAWLGRQADPDLSPAALLGALNLVVGHDKPDVNPVLWSLEWEIWGSLVLPAAVLVALVAGRWPLVSIAALTGVLWFGYATERASLMYLTPVVAGVVLAVVVDRHERRPHARGLLDHVRWAWPALFVAACVLLACSWWLRPWAPEWLFTLAEAGRLPAATVITAGAACWGAMRRVLELRPIDWLGRISFSLYLVHLPFVTGIGYRFAEDDRWLAVLIAVPVGLVVGWLFHLAVERPTIRAAAWSGRTASRLVRRPRTFTPR